LPGERLERIRRIQTALLTAASGNWRLTFWLKDGEIFDLDLEDHH
jgi:plasmid maintenance system killer protein